MSQIVAYSMILSVCGRVIEMGVLVSVLADFSAIGRSFLETRQKRSVPVRPGRGLAEESN